MKHALVCAKHKISFLTCVKNTTHNIWFICMYITYIKPKKLVISKASPAINWVLFLKVVFTVGLLYIEWNVEWKQVHLLTVFSKGMEVGKNFRQNSRGGVSGKNFATSRFFLSKIYDFK
jgi:hypothetical protein